MSTKPAITAAAVLRLLISSRTLAARKRSNVPTFSVLTRVPALLSSVMVIELSAGIIMRNSSTVSDNRPSAVTIPNARTFSKGMNAMTAKGMTSHSSDTSIGRSLETKVLTIASSAFCSRGYSSKKKRLRN